MPDAAIEVFLQRNHRAFLFCRDGGGRPVGYAMRSVTYDTGAIYFTTYAKAAKVRHLTADPTVACVVREEDGPGWVSLQGRAEVYAPTFAELDALLTLSSPETRVSDSVIKNVYDRLRSGKRAFIKIDIDEVRARG
jgi:hypothetical protein